MLNIPDSANNEPNDTKENVKSLVETSTIKSPKTADSFTDSDSDDYNKKRNEKTTLKCVICGRFFDTKDDISKHEKEEHKDIDNYRCLECNRVFSKLGYLKVHAKTHIKNKEKNRLVCTDCGENFKEKDLYKKHVKMTKHYGNNRHQCPHCPKSWYFLHFVI